VKISGDGISGMATSDICMHSKKFLGMWPKYVVLE
jgi:hypothetical protein